MYIVNLVDLVKSFPTNIFLQTLASIQKRTSPIKFAHLAEKSEKGSISNLSTKAPALAPLLRVELRVLRGERVEQVRRGVVLLLRVRLGGAKEQGAVLLGRLELERSILDKFESKEHQHPLQIPEIIMPIS